jgi:thiamine pyrophosphate-dependent acetolactate synthase large subunit-like protein
VTDREALPAWDAIARALATEGVQTVFGVLGSGNFHLAAGLRNAGATFISARHENAAVAMADGYARAGGGLGVCTVHQGPGLTNLLTGLTEAAKSHTPLLVLAADTARGDRHSNFRIPQADLVTATGAEVITVVDGDRAAGDARRAAWRAADASIPVVLMLPLDVQRESAGIGWEGPAPRPVQALTPPAHDAIDATLALLAGAERPLILGGRGAVRAGAAGLLRSLAERWGALLASSAVAKDLFAGDEFDLGICGGLSSPTGAALIAESDVILACGIALNPWTTGHGRLLADAKVIQIDSDLSVLGTNLPISIGIHADCGSAARALLAAGERVSGGGPRVARRTSEVGELIACGSWPSLGLPAERDNGVIDPRTLTVILDGLLPAHRILVLDSGHFLGWPAMYMSVERPEDFLFPQAFQSIGLGLAEAIGASVANPDRITVALVGDGGLLMSLGELETLARLRARLLVVAYNDAAYGAEVHYFAHEGHDLDGLVSFPETDFKAVAEAFGIPALTVRHSRDLDGLRPWIADPQGPLFVDAKVDPAIRASWHVAAGQIH